MGRGRHRRYRHLNIVTGFILYIHNLPIGSMHPALMTYKGIEKKYIKEDSGSSGAESFGLLVPLGYGISTFTPVAYQRSNLLRTSTYAKSRGVCHSSVLLALLSTPHSKL